MTEQEFEQALLSLGVSLTELQKQQFKTYYELLVLWNNQMNLTGITEQKDVYLKHFYDSATIIRVLDLSTETTLCDVGTGAGFPGIVLKILFPNLMVTLLDSLKKRLTFLDTVIKELQLVNIETIHQRAEDYAKEKRELYDIVTSRAVASLPILLEICVPLAKVGKYIIPMKGTIEEELNNSKHAIKELHVEIKKKACFVLPIEESHRSILLFQKQKKSPKHFPRSFKDIKNKPL